MQITLFFFVINIALYLEKKFNLTSFKEKQTKKNDWKMQLLVRGNETKVIEVDESLSISELKVILF